MTCWMRISSTGSSPADRVTACWTDVDTDCTPAQTHTTLSMGFTAVFTNQHTLWRLYKQQQQQQGETWVYRCLLKAERQTCCPSSSKAFLSLMEHQTNIKPWLLEQNQTLDPAHWAPWWWRWYLSGCVETSCHNSGVEVPVVSLQFPSSCWGESDSEAQH